MRIGEDALGIFEDKIIDLYLLWETDQNSFEC